MSSASSRLKDRLYDLNAINSALGIFGWDQQTNMPHGGAAARAEHISILSRMSHEMFVSDETLKLLLDAEKEAEPGTEDAAIVRVVRRHYDIETKFPTELVLEKAKLTTEAHEVWVDSRTTDDFSKFSPYLNRIVEIAREEARLLGYTDHVYDALLDLYEEGAKTADCVRMFDTIRQPLVDLVREIKETAVQPDDRFLYGNWDEKQVWTFCERVIKAMGFDMNRGRVDKAPHPFCGGWSIGDVRLTTRYLPYLGSAIFSCLHEAGHGVYEQGSPMAWDRLPIAGGVSSGVHESQSRLWENIVGRSREFWSFMLPDLEATIPSMRKVSNDRFYKAINKAQPSLVRVEADELTYNLHIMVRFEMECALLSGELDPKDVPEAWNEKYEKYLGIKVPNNADGCLQDVHWSAALFGYFPTYSMGNLLSYQFWAALKKDVTDVEALMAAGNLRPIHAWLDEKIYKQGSRYQPQELVKMVTGKPMGADDYLAGITAKYRDVYGI